MRTSTLLSILLLIVPVSLSACSCIIRSDNVESEIQREKHGSFAVVLARADKVTNDVSHLGSVSQKVLWTVRKSWKGPYKSGDALETNTRVECCMCGKSVDLEVSYLLFLGSSLQLSTCSMSAPEEYAKQPIAILDAEAADAGTVDSER